MSGTFTIHVTEQTIRDFVALHYRRFKWVLLIVMTALALFLGTMMRRDAIADGNAPPLWAHAIAIALVFAVLYALLVVLFHFALGRWAVRYFKQQVSLHHPAEVEWDDQGVRIHTPIDQSQRLWNDFIGWRLGDKMLLLYQSVAFANMFPITDENRDQINAIIAALERTGVKKLP